jgi:excisionase family DNA binding protein
MQNDGTVLAVGIAEAARRLGVSTRTIAELIARKQLPSRKLGRRRLIPTKALEALLQRDELWIE